MRYHYGEDLMGIKPFIDGTKSPPGHRVYKTEIRTSSRLRRGLD